MHNSEPTPPTIEYASVEKDEIPFIAPMLRWRSLCGNCVGVLVTVLLIGMLGFRGLFLNILALTVIASWAGATLSAIMTIIYMGRAAHAEIGTAYAVRHIVLAIALSTILFIGVWWVPGVVLSDLTKWRALEEQHAAP